MNDKRSPAVRPAPRPALRKADDAYVHPATPGATPGATPVARPRKADLRTRPGRSTSDVLRPKKADPAVTIKVELPNSVRKELRRQAKNAGLKAEQLAAYVLTDFVRRG